jgi:glycosyltransferase involved in cell wall biosynthesis
MLISVLMSVYYKEKPEYLQQALESIWDNQTLKPDEIIIIKDGILTEELNSVIKNYCIIAPIKIFQLEKNMGLGIALSIGIQLCKNEIIARMDSDDISLPDRFFKQFKYLNDHPEISFISSNINEFEFDADKIVSTRKVPISPKEIEKFAKSRNPMNHMAVMFRKQDVLKAGNYQPFNGYEDYYLWVRMFQLGFKGANLPESLVKARIGNNMIARRQGMNYFKQELKLQTIFYKMGFTNFFYFSKNIFCRAIPRLLPPQYLGKIYKLIRKK